MGHDAIKVWVQQDSGRPILRLQWHDPSTGKRKSKSAETSDREKAEIMAKDKEYELRHNLHREPVKTSWVEFTNRYQDEVLSGKRANTQSKAATVFSSFARIASPKNMSVIDARMISAYAAQLRRDKRSPATIHGHLAYLKAAFRWAVDQGDMVSVPKITMPSVPKKNHIRTITTEEFEKLIALAPDREWRAFISTAWYTGMRRSETLSLTWHDDGSTPWVDLDKARIWIPAACNKANADQWVPISTRLAEVLRPMQQKRGRLFRFEKPDPSDVSKAFARIAKKAGVRATLHDLRRSFGSRYASIVQAPVLQRLMRHASIQTTMDFYTNVDSTLADAIERA